jgi:hypothetical protein
MPHNLQRKYDWFSINADTDADVIAAHFVDAMLHAEAHVWPYKYWLTANTLPRGAVDALNALPFAPSCAAIHEGRREQNNDLRIYFTPEAQKKNEICRELVTAFESPEVKTCIENITGADLANGRLRIEYAQDRDGFWLEPHVDIGAKLFSMMIYLSDDPALRDAGTDIYDDCPEHRRVATAPYGESRGMIFIPAKNTWHGFTKRPLRGIRKSLIVNYVSGWQQERELS